MLNKTWEHSMIEEGNDEWFYKAGESKLIEFSHQIRRETLNEILSILKNVPNPEANRTAINRIEMEL